MYKLKFLADYVPWNLIKPETNIVFYQYTRGIFLRHQDTIKTQRVIFYGGDLIEIQYWNYLCWGYWS